MALDRAKTLEAAQKYVAKGQYDKAIIEYQKLVKETPNDVRTWLKIGDLYTRLNAKAEAVSTYDRVVDAYAQQGDFLKAIAVCKQVLKLDPQHIETQQKLAHAYEKLALVSDAIATYEQLAALYLRVNDSASVIDTLAKMAALDPLSVPVRIKYAEALSKFGKTDDAAREFEGGAKLLREQGRMDDFVKVAERLLFHRPEDATVARELALVYLERDDAKRALSKLQVCFKADPKNVETLELLAKAFERLGQTPKTISVLREVMRIFGEGGKKDERIRIARRILELDPQDADARAALAQAAPGASKAGPVPQPASRAATSTSKSQSAMRLPPAPGKPASRPQPPTPAAFDATAEEFLSEEALESLDDEAEVLLSEPPEPIPSVVPSIPPEVAQEAQIARLLTEVEVFSRYGLRNKVIEHLVSVLTIAPDHVEARDRLKTAYAESGYTTEAVEEAVILAELVRETEPERALAYAQEALGLDPEHQPALELVAALGTSGPEAFADRTDASKETIAPVDPEVALAPMSPAEFDAAPLRRTIPPVGRPQLSERASHLEQALDEADFYSSQGLYSQALGILRQLLIERPEHPLVLDKLNEVSELEGQARVTLLPKSGDDDKAFMLAERLAEELGPEAAMPEIGSDVLDVDQVFAKFKQGVEEQVGLDDTDTHFDLGIAYKEMGLLDDAIHEFSLSMTNPQRECIAETMMGLCKLEKGNITEAISHFKKGLYCETKSEREEIGLYFELGNAYELLQDPKESFYYFQKVQKRDPSFRDVQERIAALADASSAVRADIPAPEPESEPEIELTLEEDE